MGNLEIRLAEDESEKLDAFYIRHEVFTNEQGIDESLDRDGKDDEAYHFVSYIGSKPVGCARMRIIDKKAKWERIATLKEFRGNGYGARMIEFMKKYSESLDVDEIYFDAQFDAKGFYSKLGFEKRGEIFEEAGKPHIEMFMRIKNAEQ